MHETSSHVKERKEKEMQLLKCVFSLSHTKDKVTDIMTNHNT